MKKLFLVLLFIPLISFGQTAEDFFNSAKVKDSLEDYGGAIEDYTKAIELNPDNAEYYYKRGMSKYFSDDKKGSIVDFNKAIELNPDNAAEYYYKRGMSKYFSDDDKVSIVDFNSAIELNPDNAEYYNIRGRAKNYLEDYGGAIEDLNKAIELNPDNAEYYDRRGRAKNFLDDYGGAIDDFNSAIAIDSLSPTYHINLGYALEKIKKFEEANTQFSIAEKLDPSGNFQDYNTSGYYYPFIILDEDDELKYPIEASIELFIEEIFNFDTKNDQLFLRFKYIIYCPYPANYITNQNESYNITDIRESVKVDYVKSDQTKASELVYDSIPNDLGYAYEASLESSFYHNWDLRNYPFDEQKVQIRFKSSLDSTIFKFKESAKFPATFNKRMVGLKDGYQIKDITFNNDYSNGWAEYPFSPTLIRKEINPVGVFNIIISREGSWLFIKLFLGSLLSFIISWIVFLIPKKEFDSRISLTVGGIFGAIGNRYFVDSTIPPVQFLTKADMINNMILTLLILNVLIVIVQKNNKINFGLLEQNKFAMIFTGLAFVVLNTLIVLW